MALKPIVEDLATLPEEQQSLYVPHPKEEGKFILDVAPESGYELSNVENLRKALGQERKRADGAEGKLKVFGELDPSVIMKDLEELQTLRKIDIDTEAGKKAEIQIQSIKAQMASQSKEQLTRKDQEIEQLTSAIKEIVIDQAAITAIRKAGGDEYTVDTLLPHVKSKIALQRAEGNKFIPLVRDADGTPMIGDDQGSNMTVEQLVLKMKSSPMGERVFPGLNKSGGGMPQNSDGGKPLSKKVDLSKMTGLEKAKLSEEIGPEAYQALLKQ